MQLSSPPTLVPIPFADSGAKNVIPEAPSPTPGLASLTSGFPPVTMTPLAAGGIPPAGQDMNGILNLICQSVRWANAGGGYKYNSAFATDSNVGGYPQGAVLLRGDGMGYWLNLADNNTTDPEGGSPANWAPLEAYGITAVTGLTNANVTLTPVQYGLPIITLAGTLTGNVQIIFPALKSQWKIVNATTGAFTVTCKTASGTGVIVNQGGEANVYGDGTNIVLNALQIAPATASNQAVTLGQTTSTSSPLQLATAVATLPAHAVQLSQLTGIGATIAGRLIGVRAITTSGTYTPTTGTTAVRVRLVGGGGAGGGAAATSGTQTSVGAGGGSGSYSEGYFTSGFSGVSVTIGSGGGLVAGGAGGNGSASSFGALMTAPGGIGGPIAGPSAPPFPSVAAAGGIAGTGGYLNSIGNASSAAGAATTSSSIGSPGAGSLLGGGGSLPAAFTNGIAGTNGGGGSGTTAGVSSGILTGGAGGKGICIIEEYGAF